MIYDPTDNEKYFLALLSPLSGALLSIEKSTDPVFSQKIIGDGFLIEPSENLVLAPCFGTITQLHAAKHAIAIMHESGVEVLIHVGIDTVKLAGKGFKSLVKLNDKVKAKQPLIEFDPKVISQSASLQTAILITTGQTGKICIQESTTVNAGEIEVFKVDLTTPIPKNICENNSENFIEASRDIIILNPQGLHARPAAELISSVKDFTAEITIINQDNNHIASIASLTEILELQTKLGSKLTIQVKSENPEVVLDAIETAVNKGLGEKVKQFTAEDIIVPEEPLISWDNQKQNIIAGTKVSKGKVIGKLLHQYRNFPNLPEDAVDINEELQQLKYAIEKTKSSLNQLIERLSQDKTFYHKDVFVAHKQLLDDPAIVNLAENLIKKGKTAMWAWQHSYIEKANELKSLANSLLAARAADIEDVGVRVLRYLTGISVSLDNISEDTILCLDDITPSEVVVLDRNKIIAICTIGGGATSHAGILANSLAIPYIASINKNIRDVRDGTKVIFDADNGHININPSEAEIKIFSDTKTKIEQEKLIAAKFKDNPACTKDNKRVLVAANISCLEDAGLAINSGAEGVGLMRTEFVFMARASSPSVEEQRLIYSQIMEIMGDEYPVIIRTLDIGGDKPVAYLPLNKEDNPFLGERGIRVGINRPSILRQQIRALLSSSSSKIRIMLPMISTLIELRAVKKLIMEEKTVLEDKTNKTISIEIGIMVEVPSVAITADQFAKEVDFFSIGSNDLTQYTFAIDRSNHKLAKWVNSLNPALLRLIDSTVKVAKAHNKWVGICGSMAETTEAVPILVGLGLDELSISMHNIPLVKQQIRGLNYAECQCVAQQALQVEDAKSVKNLVNKYISKQTQT